MFLVIFITTIFWLSVSAGNSNRHRMKRLATSNNCSLTPMNGLSRLVAIAIVAVVLISPVIAQSGPGSHPLNEDAALALLERNLKRDHVYANRISLDCVTYGTEETTDAYFQFVLRENHNAKCGGDPETSSAVDRYRVYRRSGKIKWLEPTEDKWLPYDPAKIR
jgi:hypothetical protein